MPPAEAVAMPHATQAPITNSIVRIDVQSQTTQSPDPAQTLPGIGTIEGWPVYWFAASNPVPSDFYHTIARALLVDPVLEAEQISSNELATPLPGCHQTRWLVQKQFLPGVTDNLAKTVQSSMGLLFPDLPAEAVQIASGHAWILTTQLTDPEAIAEQLAYQLYNPLIEKLWVLPATAAHTQPAWLAFPQVPTTGRPTAEVVPLDGSDADLLKLSQSRCLALTLDEMHCIRNYYQRPTVQSQRASQELPLWPTDVELEILAQTWSEHCKHKIFAANIEFTDGSQPEYPTTTTIDSLFKTYIAGATQKLAADRPDLLSVFKDNAGVVRWNDRWGVCFKVETHNSPSALEPYGGALTGIVGVNRDILGTGLGAMPMFNTDVFCFAHPNEPHANRPGMLPPEAILTGVRKGVEDGGNKSGIPTVNGAVYFDARYRAKPLVFCGTGGLLPLDVGGKPGYGKFTQPGDTIVMAGGRVGKDGIHGATFSSEALHEASPVSSVQIGDPPYPKTPDRLYEGRPSCRSTDWTNR
jgi:hypothetical protein